MLCCIPAWLGWGLFGALAAWNGVLFLTLGWMLLGVLLVVGLFALPLGLLYGGQGLTWGARHLPSWAIWPLSLAICGAVVTAAAWMS